MTTDKHVAKYRLGVDLGGTKIEAAIVDASGRVTARRRVATPAGDYEATVAAIAGLVWQVESQAGGQVLPTGICTPGAIDPHSGLLKNANSTCLNGRALQHDLEQALQRDLRLANDADCLAVSEAVDGAGAGADSVFAVILGTGVGGGFYSSGKLLRGANAIAGEWGHNPLPWPEKDELPGPDCWCGRRGCIETWLSGPGLAADYARRTGQELDAETIVKRMTEGDAGARASWRVYEQRLARALASVINILDPAVIVLGGGVSNVPRLYAQVPELWREFVFSDSLSTRLLPARHGDASGVRGAAWLN